MLRILLNFGLNTSYKQDEFFKALIETILEFALNEQDNSIIFNLNLVLLSTKVNLISKK